MNFIFLFIINELLKMCWLREPDLNRRPSGYEPDELPSCSIPRYEIFRVLIYYITMKVSCQYLILKKSKKFKGSATKSTPSMVLSSCTTEFPDISVDRVINDSNSFFSSENFVDSSFFSFKRLINFEEV